MSCVPAWGGEILPQGVLELLGRNKWKDDEETNALPKASYSSPHTPHRPLLACKLSYFVLGSDHGREEHLSGLFLFACLFLVLLLIHYVALSRFIFLLKAGNSLGIWPLTFSHPPSTAGQ